MATMTAPFWRTPWHCATTYSNQPLAERVYAMDLLKGFVRFRSLILFKATERSAVLKVCPCTRRGIFVSYVCTYYARLSFSTLGRDSKIGCLKRLYVGKMLSHATENPSEIANTSPANPLPFPHTAINTHACCLVPYLSSFLSHSCLFLLVPFPKPLLPSASLASLPTNGSIAYTCLTKRYVG